MLKKLVKKNICPLVSLVLAFGCGKKITEKSSDPAGSSTNQQAQTREDLLIELIEKQGSVKTFRIPRPGTFRVPPKIFVYAGNGNGRKVTITYNKEAGLSNFYEFKCTYKATSASTDSFPLEKCTNHNDYDLGDLTQVDSNLDEDKNIEVRLNNPNNSNLHLHAWYEINWY